MEVEVVSVHRHRRILELDDQFNAVALGASGEIEQGVLVETKLSEDSFQTWIIALSHRCIVTAIEKEFQLG